MIMICYHHNDLDGRCAGAIVLKKYPECRMREVNYDKTPAFASEITMHECVYIVDFSFKPRIMDDLLLLTTNITWIDHHKTAKEYGYKLAGLRDFSEPGLSGCELTWKHLFPEEPMPEAVRLLGDYDTWRFDTKEDSVGFQFGLRSEPNRPDAVIWHKLLANVGCIQLKTTGHGIVNYKTNVSRGILKNGYNLTFEGHMCFVVNTPMIDSAMFDLHACAAEYGVLIAWIYDGKNYTVSMRSRSGVDVSKIAKKYGGGGHSGAAGFVIDKLPF
jgi:oligoribonuclease NrnB/cAMP/cGMP phosphodiesterase (DHH superfamily)